MAALFIFQRSESDLLGVFKGRCQNLGRSCDLLTAIGIAGLGSHRSSKPAKDAAAVACVGIALLATVAHFSAAAGEPFRQLLGDLVGRLMTVIRLLGHHAFADPHQGGRSVVAIFENTRCGIPLMLHQPLGNRSIGIRRMAGQQIVEGATQTVDIRPRVGLVAVERLLGGQIVSGAEHVFIVFQGE